MASPLHTGKKAVDLAVRGPRVSRIRRDPPPPVKEITAAELRARDAWTVAIGVVATALALFVILIATSNAAGWSPSKYKIHIRQDG